MEEFMNTRLILGGLLLAASTALFAQSPAVPDTKGGHPEGRHAMRPCAEEPDPAKCEARRKERREHMSKAMEACKDKEGPERGQCMSAQRCAKAPDPAKCQAHAKERAEHRQEMREKHDKHEKRGAPNAPRS